MALSKFLPRAENQKESPVPALPLEASGEPIASQSGCSRNSSLDRSVLSSRIQDHDFLEECPTGSKDSLELGENLKSD